MKDKEKQIEEMAKDLEPFITLHREVYVSANRKEKHGWMLSEEDNKVIAESLVAKGWVKSNEDSVVLTKEEYEKLKMLEEGHITCEDVLEFVEKARKETAEKIYSQAKAIVDATKHMVQGREYLHIDALKEIVKSCGVEIKE